MITASFSLSFLWSKACVGLVAFCGTRWSFEADVSLLVYAWNICTNLPLDRDVQPLNVWAVWSETKQFLYETLDADCNRICSHRFMIFPLTSVLQFQLRRNDNRFYCDVKMTRLQVNIFKMPRHSQKRSWRLPHVTFLTSPKTTHCVSRSGIYVRHASCASTKAATFLLACWDTAFGNYVNNGSGILRHNNWQKKLRPRPEQRPPAHGSLRPTAWSLPQPPGHVYASSSGLLRPVSPAMVYCSIRGWSRDAQARKQRTHSISSCRARSSYLLLGWNVLFFVTRCQRTIKRISLCCQAGLRTVIKFFVCRTCSPFPRNKANAWNKFWPSPKFSCSVFYKFSPGLAFILRRGMRSRFNKCINPINVIISFIPWAVWCKHPWIHAICFVRSSSLSS